jgi:hypothetical protein
MKISIGVEIKINFLRSRESLKIIGIFWTKKGSQNKGISFTVALKNLVDDCVYLRGR